MLLINVNIWKILVLVLALGLVLSIHYMISLEEKSNAYLIQKDISFINRLDSLITHKEHFRLLSSLSNIDKRSFVQCGSNIQTKSGGRKCSLEMQFLSNSSLNRVALASFPGSGNTWVRRLLEELTGIYTGSIYCDKRLKQSGFYGESIKSSSVLTIKTHKQEHRRVSDYDANEFDSTIFLIRNPYEAILSEANRKWSKKESHIGLASNEHFRHRKQWSEFISTMSNRWATTVRTWLRDDKPLLVLKYENLVSDLNTQLKKLSAFLQIKIDSAQLNCVLKNAYSEYKRPIEMPLDAKINLYYYDQDLKDIVLSAIHDVKPILSSYNIVYT